jgi:hypothetical protein
VVDARLVKHLEGRPDESILYMQDLGEKVFYGG